MSGLISVFASGEIGLFVMQYLDAVTAVSLTYTCTEFYRAIPRNSAFGVSVWRLYLSDPAYIGNRLVFETGRFLLDSDAVSRSNYKLIVCVLIQSNGFMKTSKLKSLCLGGVLKAPILPKHGKWRDLFRLDTYALKKAGDGTCLKNRDLLKVGKVSLVSFVSRVLMKNSYKPLFVSKYLSNMSSTDISSLANILIVECPIGLSRLFSLLNPETRLGLYTQIIHPYKNSMGDTFFHRIVCESSIDLIAPMLEFPEANTLLNQRNLKGETPLHLCTSSDVFELLTKKGADPNIPNSKGIVGMKQRGS